MGQETKSLSKVVKLAVKMARRAAHTPAWTDKFMHKYARKNMKIRVRPLLRVKTPKGAILFSL